MLYANDLSNALFAGDTIRPQSITGNTNGVGVDVSQEGGNLLNALLSVGAVNTLTSLDVKIQASTDNSTFTDITGATFTTVTAANALQLISFQLPTAASPSSNPYKYVRAVVTIVGTSALTYVTILGLKHLPNPTAGYSAAPPTIN